MTTANLPPFYKYARLSRYLLVAGAILLVVNVGLVNGTIFNLSTRQSLSDQLETKQAQIVGLESEYLRLAAGVTMERALALGFRDAAGATTFVRSDAHPVVALSEGVGAGTIARP